MTDLTESEKKMILERTQNIGLRKEKDFLRVVLALSELLLAMKERAKRIAHKHEVVLADREGSNYMEGYDAAASMIAADLDAPWGDLFKEKV